MITPHIVHTHDITIKKNQLTITARTNNNYGNLTISSHTLKTHTPTKKLYRLTSEQLIRALKKHAPELNHKEIVAHTHKRINSINRDVHRYPIILPTQEPYIELDPNNVALVITPTAVRIKAVHIVYPTGEKKTAETYDILKNQDPGIKLRPLEGLVSLSSYVSFCAKEQNQKVAAAYVTADLDKSLKSGFAERLRNSIENSFFYTRLQYANDLLSFKEEGLQLKPISWLPGPTNYFEEPPCTLTVLKQNAAFAVSPPITSIS